MRKKSMLKKAMMLSIAACMTMGTVPAVIYAADGIVVEEPNGDTTTTTTLKSKAKTIVNKQVKTSDSKKTKLKKLFTYAEKTYWC